MADNEIEPGLDGNKEEENTVAAGDGVVNEQTTRGEDEEVLKAGSVSDAPAAPGCEKDITVRVPTKEAAEVPVVLSDDTDQKPLLGFAPSAQMEGEVKTAQLMYSSLIVRKHMSRWTPLHPLGKGSL